jgi:AcrR family transcriptional regulator
MTARTGIPAARSDATRHRILSAAAATLSARGYSETRLSDIAKAAGLRPPAVYYYFDSRDDLIAEVMRVGQQLVREHVEQRLAEMPAGTSTIDLICTAVDAHLRVELELSDFAHAVTRNASHVPEHIRVELQRESSAYHAIWRRLLQQAKDDGTLRPGIDPGVARMLMIGALNWTAEWWDGSSSIDELIRTSIVLVRSGFFRPAPPAVCDSPIKD